jgi:hypothetical protein
MEGGKKIEAVKRYRQQTGCDLKNAKDAVEALAAKHGIVSKGAGCAGVFLMMVLACGTLGVGLAGDVERPTPPAGQEEGIVAEVARLESPNEKERAEAVKALVKIGKPAVPALIKVLSNPRNDVRASAAEALRSILASDPTSAPNYHEKAYWEQRLTQLKAGMSLDEAIAVLLPELSPAERRKSRQMVFGSGGGSTSVFRLDDYWAIVMYSWRNLSKMPHREGLWYDHAEFEENKLSPTPPVLNQRVRQVCVAPPTRYTGSWVTWYVNGQKADEGQYRNGRHDGIFTAFYDDGHKCYEQHYTEGVCHGTAAGWHRNGRKAYEGQYENDKQVGTWRSWKDNGEVQSIKEYKNGSSGEKTAN